MHNFRKRIISLTLASILCFSSLNSAEIPQVYASEVLPTIENVQDEAPTQSAVVDETQLQPIIEIKPDIEQEQETIESKSDLEEKENQDAESEQVEETEKDDGLDETESALQESNTNAAPEREETLYTYTPESGILKDGGVFEVPRKTLKKSVSLFSVSEGASKEDRFRNAAKVVKQEAKKLSRQVDISQYGITQSEFDEFWGYTLNSCVDVFYVSNEVSYSVNSAGQVKMLSLAYSAPEEAINQMTEELEDEIKVFGQGIHASWSDFEKLLYLNSYLAKHCEYDETASYEHIYDMYGCLVNKKAVCQGYTAATKYLCELMGIECGIVSSDNMIHTWNYVKADGKFYQLDICWDDPVTDRVGQAIHTFFLKSSDYFENPEAGVDSHIKTAKDWVYEIGFQEGNESNQYDNDLVLEELGAGVEYGTDNRWYGMAYDSTRRTGVFNQYNYTNGHLEYSKTVQNAGYWRSWEANQSAPSTGGGYWPMSFSGIGQYDGRLYFSTEDAIYSFDPSSDTVAKEIWNRSNEYETVGYLYGMSLENGKLTYILGRNPNEGYIQKHTIDLPQYLTELDENTSGNTIYTYNSNGNQNTGSGTEASPYNLLSTAIEHAADGDTIVIKNKGYINDDSSADNGPYIIRKRITLRGEGEFPLVSIRKGGLLLESDVTFENLSLSFENAYHPILFANGHKLTLKDVIYSDSANAAQIVAGGLTIPTYGHIGQNSGSNAVIKISGKTLFSRIYAGGLNESYSGNVSIQIDSTVKRYGNDRGRIVVDGAGARQANTNTSDWFSNLGTLDEPSVDSVNYPTSGTITVETYDDAVSAVNGYGTLNRGNVSVILRGSGNQITNLSLIDVNDISVKSGYFIPSASSFLGNSNNLSIDAGARFGINNFGNNVTIQNFQGGGGLILGASQCLSINGKVLGTTNVAIDGMKNSDMGYQSEGNFVAGRTYIQASNSRQNSFTANLKYGNAIDWTYQEASGSWLAKKTESSVEEIIPKLSDLRVKNGSSTLDAIGGMIKFADDNEGIELSIEPVFEGEYCSDLEYIPFTIQVSDSQGSMTVRRQKDAEEEYYFYKVGTNSLHMEFHEDKLLIGGYEGPYTKVPKGEYSITVTIPADYSSTGKAYNRQFLLRVVDKSQVLSANAGTQGDGDENFSNLVVFVDFQDTTHKHGTLASGKYCYKTADGAEQAFFSLFNGDENTPRTLREYIKRVSGGKIKLMNYIPQFDGDVIVPLQLDFPADYYSGTNETRLIKEIAAKLNGDPRLTGVNLDLNNQDGYLDNLTIVVPCESGNTNSLYVGHKDEYIGTGASAATINGKNVYNYTVIPESGSFTSSINGAGMIVHEFLHVCGLPDLYHRRGESGSIPVGLWDIMASENYRLQYPLAYFRARQGWIASLDEYTEDASLELRAPTTDDAASGKQAVVLKTPYSDTEFFVVEYRKKTPAYNGAIPNSYDYDGGIYGSGLVVYRVNTNVDNTSNFAGPPDGIYVFRQGDTRGELGENSNNGAIYKSFFSTEAGITSYGSADPTASTAENAITYADGQNSGIIIKNIGSASGNTISFDVEFTMDTDKLWNSGTDYQLGANMEMAHGDLCIDPDGNVYGLVQNGSVMSVIKYDGQKWSSFGPTITDNGSSYKMTYHNGNIFVASASNNSLTVKVNTGSSWSSSYTVPNSSYMNYFDMVSNGNSLYLVVNNTNTAKAEVYQYNSAWNKIGSFGNATAFTANHHIVSDGEITAVCYRDVSAGNKLVTYYYKDGNWNQIAGTLSGESGKLSFKNSILYLLKASNGSGDGAGLYSANLASDAAVWTKLSGAQFADENTPEIDYLMIGNTPYVLYTGGNTFSSYVKRLVESEWQEVGNPLASSTSGPMAFRYANGKLHVAYYMHSKKLISVKDFAISEEELKAVPYTLSFNPNGGLVNTSSKEIYINDSYGELPDASKTGYRFLGWYTQQSGGTKVEPDDTYMVYQDQTLYARYAKLYKVTFDPAGGKVTPVSKEVASGETYGVLPQPTKAGYDFTGWYTATSGGTQIKDNSIVTITKEQKLYARWKLKTCTITYNACGGTADKVSKTLTYGNTYGTLPTASRTGYKFLGWYTAEVGGTKIASTTKYTTDGNQTLYAHWEGKPFTITFQPQGGTVSKTTQTATFGKAYGTLPTPIRKGYKFLGWFTKSTEGVERLSSSIYEKNGNETLYAQWEAKNFIVSFKEDKSAEENLLEKEILFGNVYGELPTPAERAGYTFAGWFTEKGAKVEAATIYQVDSDQIVYGNWIPKQYTVSLHNTLDPEAQEVQTKSVLYERAYGSLPELKKAGYQFDGWYTEADTSVRAADEDLGIKISEQDVYSLVGDQNLYAHWTVLYKIFFMPNKGELNTSYKELTTGSLYGILPTPIRPFYAFEGWYITNEAGVEQFITEESLFELESNQDLYAKWGYKYKVEPIRITDENGTIIEDGSVISKEKRIKLSTTTERTKIYYTLDGSVPDLEKLYSKEHPEYTTYLYTDTLKIGNESEIMVINAIGAREDTEDSELLTVTLQVLDESQDWGDVTEADREKMRYSEPNNIPNAFWVTNIQNVDYTGKAITQPGMRVFKGKKLLVLNKDYTVKYANNVKAGTATITVTGKGNYSGTLVKTFKIMPLDISIPADLENRKDNTTVTPGKFLFTYNGKVQKGSVTVYYSLSGKKTTLKNGTDYTVTYPNTDSKNKSTYNANAFKAVGDYEILIQGKGNYTGKRTIVETITPCTLMSALSYSIGNGEYNYSTVYPKSLTVKKGTKVLKGYCVRNAIGDNEAREHFEALENTESFDKNSYDYIYYATNNTNIGTANIIFIGLENKNLTGRVAKTFKITGRSFASALFGKEVTNSYAWNADMPSKYGWNSDGIGPVVAERVKDGEVSVKNPSVTYKVSTKQIDDLKGILKSEYTQLEDAEQKKAYDYTYEYVGSTDKIGTVKIVFTGINRYSGTVSKSYKITGRSLSSATFGSEITKSYAWNVDMPSKYGWNSDGIGPVVAERVKDGEVSVKNPSVTYKVSTKQIDDLKGILKSEYTQLEDAEQKKAYDYTYEYVGSTDKIGTVKIVFTGINRYSGTVSKSYKITGRSLSSATFGSEITKSYAWNVDMPSKYGWNSDGIGPVVAVREKDGEVSVKNPSVTYKVSTKQIDDLKGILKSEYTQLEDEEEKKSYDYTYEYVGNLSQIGAVKIVFTGINRYSGSVTKTFNITGTAITKMSVAGVNSSYSYTKNNIKPAGEELSDEAPTGFEVYAPATKTAAKKVLVKGRDYSITYQNNVKVGTATILITGKNGYSGTLKKTFKISGYNLLSDSKLATEKRRITVESIGEKLYTKGGVKPIPVVMDGDYQLRNNTDFTLKYSNNSGVNNGSNTSKRPTVTITGKGNYAGSIAVYFTISKSDISTSSISAGNVVYQKKANICKPAITITDGVSKTKLAAGTDYDSNIKYYYAEDPYESVIQIVNKKDVKVTRVQGDTVDLSKDIIPAGTRIRAVVSGKNNYTGKIETEFRVIKTDISKATVSIGNQEYTGKPITLDKSKITVTYNKKAISSDNFEIVKYENNVNMGTAKVTLKGINDLGGSKTVTFKIVQKPMYYVIEFKPNGGTGTMKTINASGDEVKLTANAFKNGKKIFTGWNTKADGSGTYYSDKQAVSTIGKRGQKLTLYAMWVQATGVSLSQAEIQGEAGDKVQLSARVIPNNVGNSKITWKSENTNIAEVNENGLVSLKKNGVTNILAYAAQNNVYASCMVKVGSSSISGDQYVIRVRDLPNQEDATDYFNQAISKIFRKSKYSIC
ncbi:MAG: InlB B-repeat-containing protein [Lachnospiraceae bacterium]|nr:InlB B-repeat-containing protein [Lachnospiraceae bacterium]